MKHKITTYDDLIRRFGKDFMWTHEGNGRVSDNFFKAILHSMKNNNFIKNEDIEITEEFVDL